MGDEGAFMHPRSQECSFAVVEAFDLFKRLDPRRGYFFTQGMKSPSYENISSRQILDEIELQEPITDKMHLSVLIDAMDSIVLQKKNKPS